MVMPAKTIELVFCMKNLRNAEKLRKRTRDKQVEKEAAVSDVTTPPGDEPALARKETPVGRRGPNHSVDDLVDMVRSAVYLLRIPRKLIIASV